MTNPNEATALGRALPISPKMSMVICSHLKGKTLTRAKALLKDVIDMKKPLSFKKFNKDLCHKPGTGPARYPLNASKHILSLLNSLQANAEHKGLNPEKIIISSAIANFAARRWHSGRQRRTRIKSAHIQLTAQETTQEKKEHAKSSHKKSKKNK